MDEVFIPLSFAFSLIVNELTIASSGMLVKLNPRRYTYLLLVEAYMFVTVP